MSHWVQMPSLSLLLAKVLLLSCVLVVQSAPSPKKEHSKLPSFVKICHRNSPQLNVCARNSLNSLKERLSVGIPELFIPAIEPLIIPEIKLDQDSGAIYLHSTYKNIYITGLSNFTLTELTIDPVQVKLTMSMTFPKVSMNATYLMEGKIMMMPLQGEGDCQANFTNVELNMVLSGQRYKKHSRYFIKVQDIKMKYHLGKAQMRLENLFNGDNALGERMNVFLNENWDSLSEEVRPLMENAMSEVVRSSTDKLFNAFSYDDLLPE